MLNYQNGKEIIYIGSTVHYFIHRLPDYFDCRIRTLMYDPELISLIYYLLINIQYAVEAISKLYYRLNYDEDQ